VRGEAPDEFVVVCTGRTRRSSAFRLANCSTEVTHACPTVGRSGGLGRAMCMLSPSMGEVLGRTRPSRTQAP